MVQLMPTFPGVRALGTTASQQKGTLRFRMGSVGCICGRSSDIPLGDRDGGGDGEENELEDGLHDDGCG